MAAGPDPTGAFVPGPPARRPGAPGGPLTGLSFAAKDLFDVAGVRKTCGNPDWWRTHPPASRTAPVIERLLAAGADLVGMTVLDELAFSLEGINVHYGTPTNPRALGRIPGGSSSGSASAVAAGSVAFALGTDTGGSVRVPASFCGLCGLRPTHGRLPVDGLTPLAPSLDTVGWLARDGETLSRVGAALWGLPPPGAEGDAPPPFRARWVVDAFEVADPMVGERIQDVRFPGLEIVGGVHLLGGDPRRVVEAYRAIQGRECWQIHGPWIEEARPQFAPEIAERFRQAAAVRPEEAEAAQGFRAALDRRIASAIDGVDLLLVPAAPCEPLPVGRDAAAAASFRRSALAIEGLASLTGRPEVVVPLPPQGEGLPVGLGAIGRRGDDERLLAAAALWA
ncbi:MAG: amidase [Thermoplasmata archaeon]